MYVSDFIWMLFAAADSNHIYSGEGFDDEESRAKTAPSKRKSWIHDSVELRTEDGDPIHVKAPGQMIVN